MNFYAVMRELSAFYARITGITNNKRTVLQFMRISLLITVIILTSIQLLLAFPVKGQNMHTDQVKVNLKHQSVEEAIHQIEQQTSFIFFYRKSSLTNLQILNLPYASRTVEQTLTELLKNTFLTFRQVDNHIFLESSTEDTSYEVSGRVISIEHKPVEMATITLKNASNLKDVQVTFADTTGNFKLTVAKKGNYLLVISAVGMDSLTIGLELSDFKMIKLPDITLHPFSHRLKEVSVLAQRPLLTRSIDKLTLNVEGSVYEKGEDGLRLFNVIPGVQVTGRDILFRGSESVTVYVDNRRVMLPADQLFAYLRSIPSESIKSYELKVVPGAENEAQNGGVIINIVLKSEYKYGLSGNVSGGYWYNGNNNVTGSTLINYRVGKLTMQGSFNYLRSPAFYEDYIIQEFKSTKVYSQQTEKYTEDYNFFSYNVGMDYKLTDKQTIGANYNMFTNPGDISNATTTNINFLANAHANSVDSSLYTNNGSKFRYINQMANAFYRNKLDSLGSKLDMGYSYIHYDLNDPRPIETKFLNSAGAEFHPRDSLFTNNSGKSTIHAANIDVEKYFSKSLVLNIGGKYTGSKTDYSMDYRHGLTGVSPLDTLRSNRFLYNEQILAFYGTLAQSFNQWQVKVGLRTEQTNYNGKSVTTGQTIGRNQWDLFPSAYVNRKIGETHSFTLSYARRIDRPGFRQLNPFTSITSLNSVQEGNPNLLPYYSNNVQLEYLLKNKYSLTVGYQNTEKAIASRVTNVGDVIISKDENISNNNNVFMSLYIPIKVTKWWEINTNATLRYSTIDVRTIPAVHRSKLSQNIWASNKFNLPGKYFIEVSGSYNRNNFYGIYDASNSGKLDMTIKKSFFKDRLTSRITTEDPFHLYKPGYVINTTDFTRKSVRNRLAWSRYVGIWLTYNFSSGKKQTNRENIDAGGNEARGRL